MRPSQGIAGKKTSGNGMASCEDGLDDCGNKFATSRNEAKTSYVLDFNRIVDCPLLAGNPVADSRVARLLGRRRDDMVGLYCWSCSTLALEW
ncbi:hypothetical protein [Burkholderia metallica]|uniref:hypothetical protein n=1 Tax=Burkholderia metallica TaxID=488729 RepID=UPI00157AC27F|nr:hypothetical protein [Burkholderia metallica]